MFIFNFTVILGYLHFYSGISNIKGKKYNIFKHNMMFNEDNSIDNFSGVDNHDSNVNIFNNFIDTIEHEIDDMVQIESNKKKYYKKIKGYDERFCLNSYDLISCNENKYNNTIELNKIRGFLEKKQLFEKLVNIIKFKKDNETLQHLLESNTLEDIKQYNNDSKNISIYTHNILSCELFNDW
jgi:hypothetical protein